MLLRRNAVGVSGLLLAAILAGAAPAAGTTTSFTSQSAFVSQTGSSLLTLPNGTFNLVTIPGQLTIDGFSPGSLISGTTAFASFFNLAPNFLAKGGTESFDITPLTPSYAFGFTLYEPTSSALLNGCNTTCVQSTFGITLFSGSTNIGSFSVQPADNQLNFYGFWSSDPITSVQIRETVGTDDNEFFGQFYLGSTSQVPEPASLVLVAVGLAGFAVRKRFR